MALVVRSWPALCGAAVPPWFLPAVGAAYLLLALAVVYLTKTELRLPLVLYRARAQVGRPPPPPLSFPVRQPPGRILSHIVIAHHVLSAREMLY